VLVAGADQGQPAPLRSVGFQGLAEQRAAQVAGQGRPHAHGEHAGLFKRSADHGRAIAGGENQRIGFGLQRIAHPDEARLVQRQAGVGQPGCAAGLGHPDDLIGLQGLAAAGLQTVPVDADDFRIKVQRDAPLLQNRFETAAHGGIVGRQDRGAGGEQVHAQFIGVAPLRRQFPA
jgi:hypothetical protein